jgi:hypothetical protein
MSWGFDTTNSRFLYKIPTIMDLQIYILWKIIFLFCFICHVEISQMKAPFTKNFCYFWKAIKWIGVYWGGLQCLDLDPIKIKGSRCTKDKVHFESHFRQGSKEQKLKDQIEPWIGPFFTLRKTIFSYSTMSVFKGLGFTKLTVPILKLVKKGSWCALNNVFNP